MEFGMKRVVASVQVVAILTGFTTAALFPSHLSARNQSCLCLTSSRFSRSCAAVKLSPASVVLVVDTTLAKQTPAWLAFLPG